MKWFNFCRERVAPVLLSANAIGLYFTLAFSYAALYYYQNLDYIRSENSKYRILLDLDQKSLDYRLQIRGPQPPDRNVAVLAIDDRSIEIVGRWPWPRDTLGIAIDNTFKNGTKVIASDIVWSEASDRPEVKMVRRLEELGQMTPELKTRIAADLDASNPDKIFGDQIEKNQKGFIVGNFFSNSIKWQDKIFGSGYETACHDIIYKNDPLVNLIQRQEKPLVVIDSSETIMPEAFSLAYEAHMDEIESDFRASHAPPKSGFEAYIQQREILNQKINFCDNQFLKTDKDQIASQISQNWDQIKSTLPEISLSSYEEWFRFFKANNLRNMIPETLDWTLTIPDIVSRATQFGYFNAELDNDGTIRKSQLITRTGSKYVPSIALQAYTIGTGQQIQVNIKSISGDLKGVAEMIVSNDEGDPVYQIPVTADGLLTINYAGGSHMVPHASIADLLNEDDPNITVTQKRRNDNGEWVDEIYQTEKKAFLKDKTLVLGATAIGIFDLRVTPFDENFPGVETHANVIDNLIQRKFLSRSPFEGLYMPIFMLIIGLVMSFALSRFGALSGLLFTFALVFLIGYVDNVWFFSKGILVSIVLPLVQVISTFVFLTFYKYFTEERSKKELRATFSKYVSPSIVEEILKDPKNLELGGRKERVTVFFSDVRGFTTISEKLDPRALSDLLNSYLTPMTELVFKNRGTLDKYMGDAVMAFFGAPVHYQDHAKMACLCALQSLEKLAELREIYKKKNLPMIDIGIGLNTGECSVGNMGSETVRSYTVMGDTVNLASRLEGINKSYGSHIIISEFTYAEVKTDFTCREVDLVRVKGKLEPVQIYELISEGKAQPHINEMVRHFEDGYQLYHQRQFQKAIEAFHRSSESSPTDETAKIYIQRCQDLISEPPPEDWDGVFVMKTK